MSEFPWFASYPQGVPHEIDPDVYPNLSAVLDESAKKFPNHVGYTNLGADATYAQMKGYAESFAAYLQSLPDMKPGDRIALMMPNLLQYVAAVFGILKAGMVVVNINPLYTPREVNHTLKDSGAKFCAYCAKSTRRSTMLPFHHDRCRRHASFPQGLARQFHHPPS